MKRKLNAVLLALTFDKDFHEYIEKEYHAFYSVLGDIIGDSSCDWEDMTEEIKQWGGERIVNTVYDELCDFY